MSSWIGRKFKCVYGLNMGDKFTATSEPYCIDMYGHKAVDGISDNGLESEECDALENSIYWEEIE